MNTLNDSIVAIYKDYPLKIHRKMALIAIAKAIERLGTSDATDFLHSCVRHYSERTEVTKEKVLLPAKWFNGERYFDIGNNVEY